MIHRLTFNIKIDTDNRFIWMALWEDKYYREWISAFGEGSYFKTPNWDEGTTIHFLGHDENGIYSKIEKHIPNELIRFKHIGNVLNGQEQVIDESVQKWSGANEMYSIENHEDHNVLKVDIDIMEEHLEFMKSNFPKALETIKRNSLNMS